VFGDIEFRSFRVSIIAEEKRGLGIIPIPRPRSELSILRSVIPVHWHIVNGVRKNTRLAGAFAWLRIVKDVRTAIEAYPEHIHIPNLVPQGQI
jgi:hypothetical protein